MNDTSVTNVTGAVSTQADRGIYCPQLSTQEGNGGAECTVEGGGTLTLHRFLYVNYNHGFGNCFVASHRQGMEVIASSLKVAQPSLFTRTQPQFESQKQLYGERAESDAMWQTKDAYAAIAFRIPASVFDVTTPTIGSFVGVSGTVRQVSCRPVTFNTPVVQLR